MYEQIIRRKTKKNKAKTHLQIPETSFLSSFSFFQRSFHFDFFARILETFEENEEIFRIVKRASFSYTRIYDLVLSIQVCRARSWDKTH